MFIFMTPMKMLHIRNKADRQSSGQFHGELRYLGQLLDGEEALHAMEMGVNVLQRTNDQQKVWMEMLPSATEQRTSWLDDCIPARFCFDALEL